MLPLVVRRVLVGQVSNRLHTRVDIGDVDLALHRGGVALKDVAIYSPTPGSPDEPPLVAWKKLAIELRYLPLFRKIVQVRSIELDGPHVALDRLANGELNLQSLVPAPDPNAAPAEKQQPSSWKVGLDRIALRTGVIRFRDLAVQGGEPLEVAIPNITVDDVALQPGLYGAPGQIRMYVRTEGGAVRLDANVWMVDQGFALGARLKALGLPVRRARLYVAGVGWSELQGELDLAVDYGLAPGGKNELTGLLRVRHVAIRVPDLTEAAFGLERLAVWVDPLDVATQRVRLSRVDLRGASVVANLQGGDVLPLLRRGGKAPPQTPPAAPEPATGAPAKPWHWAVRALRLTQSKVALLQEGAPLEIGVMLRGRSLSDDGEPGRIDLRLGVPPGSVAIAGAVRPSPPAFGGTVRIEALAVHDVVRAARAAAHLPPGLLRSATLGTDLTIAAGLTPDGATPDHPDTVRITGSVGVDDVSIVGPDPQLFSVGWKHFAVPIDELALPGTMPGSQPAPGSPIHVALGAVRIEEPAVQLTRTADGIVLPPPLGRSPGEAAPAPPAESAPPSSGGAPGVDATIASFVLAKGRIGFADQTVKPFFAGEIRPLDVDARGIRSQGLAVERFTVSATTPQKGTLDVSGSVGPEGGKIQMKGKEIALTPYNPYVTTYSSYSLGRGSSLSILSDVVFGKGSYDTKTALTLHRLAVRGAAGDTLFKEHFGVPLTLAIALLRDLQGNIKLDIPVVVDQSGTKVALGTVVTGALRSAILGAVTSPLKGIGAMVGAGDTAAIEPPPIGMELGRAVLTPDGEKQAGQLAELLAGRPGLGVELDGIVTPADVRWLQEQDLRAELEARTGMVNALRGLSERNARRRIVQALTERSTGKAGDLDADDRTLLDKWLAERPPVPADRIRALARERAEAAATALRERHGIPAARITVAEAAAEPREGQPSVAIGFGAGEG